MFPVENESKLFLMLGIFFVLTPLLYFDQMH